MFRLIAGEFYKMFTTRLWLWLLLVSTAIAALYASLDIAFSDDPNTLTMPLATPQGQRTLFATAAGAAAPIAAVLGAIGLTGEFRHRTATATFLSTPARGRVIAAKLVTYGLVGTGFGVACTAVVGAVAFPWLATKGVELSVAGSDFLGWLAGDVATVAIYGVIGVGLGALWRDQVATVAGLFVYLYVVEPVLTRVPALSDWTVFLPGSAHSALTGITLVNQQFLQPWQGGLVLVTYAILFAGIGAHLVIRRDVT